MSTKARSDKWSDHQITSAALLAAMLLLVTSATGLESANGRPSTHAAAQALHGVPACMWSDVNLLPNQAMLAPASDLKLGIGARPETAIQRDLSHLAGTSLLTARERWNRPPPTAC